MTTPQQPFRLAVFCGSSTGNRPAFTAAAETLGAAIAARGWELVYGGGRVGLMGLLADATLRAGAPVTGVIPRFLLEKEVGHSGLTRMEVVETMHERKERMAALSDGFLALPGGYGTFEELFEAITWTQLGLHDKPCVLLNVEGFYDPVAQLIDGAVATGLMKEGNRRIVSVCADVPTALGAIGAWRKGSVEAKWIKG